MSVCEISELAGIRRINHEKLEKILEIIYGISINDT